MTLTDFLLARVAEDEAAAKADEMHATLNLAAESGGWAIEADEWPAMLLPGRPGHHARVLADVEAKRRIVAEHPATEPFNHEGDRYCANCLHDENRDDYPDFWTQQMYPCRTLRLLALPYADHEDYDPEWRP